LGIFQKIIGVLGERPSDDATVKVRVGFGSGADVDKKCSPGRYYVYLHRDPEGFVFYVGKGTGARAQDRFTVEIPRRDISEEDALDIEDAYMHLHAATIVNRQNIHAPVDTRKFLAYSDAMGRYSTGLKMANELAAKGRLDEAVAEFEAAYRHWHVAGENADYDLGARKELKAGSFSTARPSTLATCYSKVLMRVDRYAAVVDFAERYFLEYGPPYTPSEDALRSRAERAARALDVGGAATKRNSFRAE